MWPGLFLLYVIVEVSALVALTSTVGIGWTILAVVGAFVIGLVLAGSQARRALGQLRRGGRSPGGAIADGALIALGTIAVVIPGLVSSALGLLLLLPPTRAVLPAAPGVRRGTAAESACTPDQRHPDRIWRVSAHRTPADHGRLHRRRGD